MKRILLTNDDGYRSEGIRALYRALKKFADVTVVAPESEKSAVGMGVTLTRPIRVSPIDDPELEGYYIDGTPSDCVKTACGVILKDNPPDYVFSGINQGSNVGLNALYSGTVAGAVEGTLCGVPSVAVSLCSFRSRDFRAAQKAAGLILEKLDSIKLGRFELLNVNVPELPEEEIRGMKLARMSYSVFREKFEKRMDPREKEYYWLGGVAGDFGSPAGSDVDIIQQGYIAVTPLQVDLTAFERLQDLESNGWNHLWSGETR